MRAGGEPTPVANSTAQPKLKQLSRRLTPREQSRHAVFITYSTESSGVLYVHLFATSQEDPVSRFRRFSLVAVLTAMLLALGLPTFAASPVTVSGSVTDPSEWLESSDRESVEEAARKAAASGVNISFVFVEDLSGDSVSQWCAQTLENSTLGYSDVVFVLAYTERVDGACSENSQTSARINAAIASADKQFKSNPLTSNDAANGAAAFANALIASSASSTPSASPQPTRSSSSADRTNLYILSALFFGGLSLFGITVAVSSRRSKKSAAHAMSIDSVAAEKAVQEANRQLLAADEQVRTATDELNFARAQFGLTSTDEFARAIENAKAAVTRCFDLQGSMNDATATTVRLELAKKLMRDLGANLNPLSQIQAAFATKRAEEATLPERIREARERLAEELTDLERAKAELATIAGIYPAQMLASLQDNPEQAAALLTSARTALDTADEVVDTDRTRAASALDTAHRALTMANHQTDAIFTAKSDLDAIRDRLAGAIGSISADLSDVERLDTDPATFTPLVADARAAISEAQAALANNGDPLAALEHLRTAEATIDAALAPLRTNQEARDKAYSAAKSQIALAESAVGQAQRYVQGRRGAIDLQVRGTLNNAEQALRAAHDSLDKDPQAAATHAANARAFADRVMATPIQPTTGSWGSGTSNNGSFTGSSLGDFLLWSTLFSQSGPGYQGRRDRDYDRFDHFDRGSRSSGSGWSFASSSGSNWGGGFGGASASSNGSNWGGGFGGASASSDGSNWG